MDTSMPKFFSFFMLKNPALLDTRRQQVTSPVRADGSEKWVDFAYSFLALDCVRKAGITYRYKEKHLVTSSGSQGKRHI